jgi:PPP family 3-phenylpropionic acid transporter
LYGILGGFAAATAAACAIPATRLPALAPPVSAHSVRGLRALSGFYVACLLMQFSHGTYYGFFSIWLESRGWAPSSLGALWTASILVEVAFMFWSARAMGRLGAEGLFVVAFAAAVARWALMSASPGLVGLMVAQGLHALTFGAFHVAAVTLVHRTAPPSLRSTGQTLYSSLAYGVGSAGGSLVNGALYAAWGAAPLFALSALAALGGLIFAVGFLRAVRRERP